MAGNLTPGQMFDHSLIELSGRSTMHALDYSAAPASGELVYEGSVMTLNSNGEFVAGMGSGVANTQVFQHKAPLALFMIQGTNEFDANSDVGNMSGGAQSGIVASGGYEIQTTEFVAGTYNPNDLMTFATGADRGDVTLAKDNYTDCHIVGVVSKGTETNVDNKSVISFWTVFCPAVNSSKSPLDNSSSSTSSNSSSSSSTIGKSTSSQSSDSSSTIGKSTSSQSSSTESSSTVNKSTSTS